MFIATIDTDVFYNDTQEGLDREIKDYIEGNLNIGETYEVTYFQPAIKKSVTLDFHWTVISGAPTKTKKETTNTPIEI